MSPDLESHAALVPPRRLRRLRGTPGSTARGTLAPTMDQTIQEGCGSPAHPTGHAPAHVPVVPRLREQRRKPAGRLTTAGESRTPPVHRTRVARSPSRETQKGHQAKTPLAGTIKPLASFTARLEYIDDRNPITRAPPAPKTEKQAELRVYRARELTFSTELKRRDARHDERRDESLDRATRDRGVLQHVGTLQ